MIPESGPSGCIPRARQHSERRGRHTGVAASAACDAIHSGQLAQLGEHLVAGRAAGDVAGVEVAGVLAADLHQGALPVLKILGKLRICRL